MEEVREVVDIDLGITDRNQPPVPGKELQAFLYISNANKVIASAFVEHIEKVRLRERAHFIYFVDIKSHATKDRLASTTSQNMRVSTVRAILGIVTYRWFTILP